MRKTPWLVLITLLALPLSVTAGEMDDLALDRFKLCVGCGKGGAEGMTDDPPPPKKLKLELGLSQDELRELGADPNVPEEPVHQAAPRKLK